MAVPNKRKHCKHEWKLLMIKFFIDDSCRCFSRFFQEFRVVLQVVGKVRASNYGKDQFYLLRIVALRLCNDRSQQSLKLQSLDDFLTTVIDLPRQKFN